MTMLSMSHSIRQGFGETYRPMSSWGIVLAVPTSVDPTRIQRADVRKVFRRPRRRVMLSEARDPNSPPIVKIETTIPNQVALK